MLDVNRLSIYTGEDKPIIHDIDFTIPKGTTVGVIGMSGAGKTMLCLALLRLLNSSFYVKGDIQFQGQSLLSLSSKEMSRIRGREIGFLTQHPFSALDPIYTVGTQMVDTVRTHFSYSKSESRQVLLSQLRAMDFKTPEHVLRRYPFELSGGMLQRVMVGLALILKPSLIIADEPTTALDTVNQQKVLEQLSPVGDNQEHSLILVSHDLAVIGKCADEVLVLESGTIVEHLSVEQFYTNPRHAYTKELLRLHQKLNGGSNNDS